MKRLKREDRHALLVTVLTSYAPWVTVVSAAGFLVWWVASLTDGHPDEAALTMVIAMVPLTALAWAARAAIRGFQRDPDQKP